VNDTTSDRLLGGRITFVQPARGYRAAIDPVLLAAFVPAGDGETVLEAGIGAGAAALCLLARVDGCRVTGVEIDPALAALARANAAANGLDPRLAVIESNVVQLRHGRFDHAMANPPFQPHGSGSRSPDATRARADREAAPDSLATWIAALSRRLAPRGTLNLVLPAARLGAACAALRDAGLGALTVLPAAPRAGEPASRLLLRGSKGARGPDTLLPPLVLHAADGAFTDAADAVLRGAGALPAATCHASAIIRPRARQAGGGV
jgi:tRNA1(Val) A37 N6-methylase TrmN6